MKKIFLSLPMSGRTDIEIMTQIEEMKAEFLLKNPFDEGEEIVFVDNLENDIDPSRCVDVKTEPLLYLGEAIRKMAYCDAVVFKYDWEKARGCRIEHEVAWEYGIPCYIITANGRRKSMDDKIKNTFKSTKVDPLEGMDFTYEISRQVREDNENFIFETIEPFCSNIAQQKMSKKDLSEAIQLWMAAKKIIHVECSETLMRNEEI